MRTPIRLNKTIGEAYDMDLADALTAKQALASLDLLEPPEDGVDEYPDRPMIEAVKSFQRAEGLAEDGVMKPDGPTLEQLNHALSVRQKVRPQAAPNAMSAPDQQRISGTRSKASDYIEPVLRISDQVGQKRTNRPRDILALQGALAATGHGDPYRLLGMTPAELSGEIKKYQQANGLKVDGWASPGGETVRALSSSLAPKLDEAEKQHPQLIAGKRRQLSEKEKDLCDDRLRRELYECVALPGEWHGPCTQRAYERWAQCYRYGYTPGPDREPNKWGPGDMERWFNPRR